MRDSREGLGIGVDLKSFSDFVVVFPFVKETSPHCEIAENNMLQTDKGFHFPGSPSVKA